MNPDTESRSNRAGAQKDAGRRELQAYPKWMVSVHYQRFARQRDLLLVLAPNVGTEIHVNLHQRFLPSFAAALFAGVLVP